VLCSGRTQLRYISLIIHKCEFAFLAILPGDILGFTHGEHEHECSFNDIKPGTKQREEFVILIANSLNVPLESIEKSIDYLETIRNFM